LAGCATEGQECKVDSDCFKDSCCHPTGCSAEQPECRGTLCSLSCEPGTLDCGGSCACVKGACVGQNYLE